MFEIIAVLQFAVCVSLISWTLKILSWWRLELWLVYFIIIFFFACSPALWIAVCLWNKAGCRTQDPFFSVLVPLNMLNNSLWEFSHRFALCVSLCFLSQVYLYVVISLRGHQWAFMLPLFMELSTRIQQWFNHSSHLYLLMWSACNVIFFKKDT